MQTKLWASYLIVLFFLFTFAHLDSINDKSLETNSGKIDDPIIYPNFKRNIEPNISISFSTYFGGLEDDTETVSRQDQKGNFYLSGITSSNNFPTENAFKTSLDGDSDIFLAKFTSDGSLVFSTFIGGNSTETILDILIDSEGSV